MKNNNNNKIVRLAKLKQSSQEEIKNSIETHFKLKDFQTYFPVMSYWEEFENNSYSKQLFILNSKYQLTSLERQSDKSKTVFLGYLKKQTNLNSNKSKKNKKDNKSKKDLNKIEIELKDVRNDFNLDINLDELKEKEKENKKLKHEIHFKINPILEPINSIMNKYKLENSTSLMPNVFDYITNKKINSPNNFSYVETLFAYLASNLVEKGKCPSFPYYYGSYLGISETFKQDITDDYHTIRKHSWFNENRDRLFELEKISIEEQLCESIPDLPKVNSLEQKNKDTSLGVEEVDFDNFEIPENSPKKRHCSASSSCSSNKSNNNTDNITSFIETLDDDNITDNNTSFIETLDDDTNITKEDGEEDKEEDKEDGEEDDDKEEDEEANDDKEEDEEDEDDDKEWETESECESKKDDEDDEENESDENSDESSSKGSSMNSKSDDDNNSDDDDIFDEEMDDFTYNVKIKDFPVQLIAMEKLNQTLDELLKNKKLSEQEWLGVLFQICFGLSMVQKHFKFTHNDLHSSNIMFKATKTSYLYFAVNGIYYRIPTFGKITKIIDFARAVFTVDGHQFFSDVFKSDGDAEGQYTYPYHKGTHIKYAPNPSFDLSYLAITIREHFTHDSPIFTLLEKWTTDKYGNNLAHHTVDFDLYIKIAHNVNSAIPKNQFKNPLFNQFKIKKTDIPKNNYIYYL